MNTQNNSTKLAKMAMLVAVSIVLVALIHLPILPMVPFLEYDPADIPILLGSFAFGPGAGIRAWDENARAFSARSTTTEAPIKSFFFIIKKGFGLN